MAREYYNYIIEVKLDIGISLDAVSNQSAIKKTKDIFREEHNITLKNEEIKIKNRKKVKK